MSESTSACNASMCCETRLASLEKRVSRIRTCLLIALGALILLIGIAIGKVAIDARCAAAPPP